MSIEVSGRVFSIEEFSTFDGPGIRTTVFLKGCPLRCVWCHNPEGQSFENEIVKSPNGCLGCGACLDCGERLTGKRRLVYESITACPRNLIRLCADDYTPDDLCGKLMKNSRVLQAAGGGVTFSGGEPLAQPSFLNACLTRLAGRMHRALQTSGACDEQVFASTLGNCDYVLFDLKLIDPESHRRYTGASNRTILTNYTQLCRSKRDHIVRLPLIPGVTDTVKNIKAIAALMQKNQDDHIEILPYNKMAGGKYPMVGRTYAPPFNVSTEPDPHLEIFKAFGILADQL